MTDTDTDLADASPRSTMPKKYHPKLLRTPTMDKEKDLLRRWLLRAYAEAANSPDPNTQNGAGVYVLGRREDPPFDIPYEGDSEGNVWTFAGAGHNKPVGDYDREMYKSHRDYRLAVTIHAEVSAIVNASKNGHALRNAVLVCPWSACYSCAGVIGESGIKTLVRHKRVLDFADKTRKKTDQANWSTSIEQADRMLRDYYDVSIIDFDGEVGGIPIRNSGKEFQP